MFPRVIFLLNFHLYVAVSKEKQAPSHEKSDESIIFSAVKELIPSLEERYTFICICFCFWYASFMLQHMESLITGYMILTVF